MKIGTIDNNAQNTVEAFLQTAAKDASALDWASAFITSAGLNSVLYLLKAAARNSKVRLLTGLYQGFTEPAALRTLLTAQENSKGRFEVRISKDRHFHWKSYFVFGKQTVRLVIGSSNLTNDGLNASGEFNLAVTVPKNSKELKQVHGVFEKHWKHQAVPLRKSEVDKYALWHKSSGGSIRMRKPPMASILGNQTRNIPVKSNEINYYRDSVNRLYFEETLDLLAKTTNWDRKGYSSFNYAERYKVGDRVVLFDFADERIRVVEITDTTTTPVRTPDGKHFAAYKIQTQIPLRKITRNRLSSLKKSGLIASKDDARLIRKLSAAKFQQFIDNLKKTV